MLAVLFCLLQLPFRLLGVPIDSFAVESKRSTVPFQSISPSIRPSGGSISSGPIISSGSSGPSRPIIDKPSAKPQTGTAKEFKFIDHKPVKTPVPLVDSKQATQQSNREIPDVFQVTCSFIPYSECLRSKQAIGHIGRKLARIFRINKTINVHLKHSYDPLTLQVSCRSIVPVQIVARYNRTGPFLAFPVALAKQFPSTRPILYQQDWNDIEILLNPRIRFWLPDDGYLIPEQAIDLEYALTHAILHGMGFSSSIRKDYSVFHPLVRETQTARGTLNEWYPPSVFESRLVMQDGSSVMKVMNEIRKLDLNSGSNASPWISIPNIVKVNWANGASREVSFRTTRGQFIPINVEPNQNTPGHLPDSFFTTVDFIMARHAPPGLSLGEKIRSTTLGRGLFAGASLGPWTIEILRSIGWQTRDDPIRPVCLDPHPLHSLF